MVGPIKRTEGSFAWVEADLGSCWESTVGVMSGLAEADNGQQARKQESKQARKQEGRRRKEGGKNRKKVRKKDRQNKRQTDSQQHSLIHLQEAGCPHLPSIHSVLHRKSTMSAGHSNIFGQRLNKLTCIEQQTQNRATASQQDQQLQKVVNHIVHLLWCGVPAEVATACRLSAFE